MRGYTASTLKTAKKLRNDMTNAERKLWSVLRNGQMGGAKFRRQQPIGSFVADFVCHEQRLIIEADGGQHAESAADESRTAFLTAAGYRVLRFWNNDIIANLEGVTDRIACELRSNPRPDEVSNG